MTGGKIIAQNYFIDEITQQGAWNTSKGFVSVFGTKNVKRNKIQILYLE